MLDINHQSHCLLCPLTLECCAVFTDKAQMKDALSALPEQLDTPVGEGGDAFSVGARHHWPLILFLLF